MSEFAEFLTKRLFNEFTSMKKKLFSAHILSTLNSTNRGSTSRPSHQTINAFSGSRVSNYSVKRTSKSHFKIRRVNEP